jgi:hypothetical protein
LSLLIWLLGSGFALAVALVVYFLTHPEKVEIWASLLARFLSNLGRLFRGAHKKYVQLDLQGRINDFTRKIAKEAPYVEAKKVRIELQEGAIDRESFLKEGRVLLRLRRDDPDDLNFVHGAYLFVSTALLHRTKRYISPSHRESIDLYVTTKLIEKEKTHLVGLFLDEYLHPKTADPSDKVSVYFDKFSKIDRAAAFFPVLLQELDFLGGKVFGRRQDDRIIIEVNNLVEFLEKFAGRRVGEESDLNFEQEYCRFAIVIVGKAFKLSPEGEVYVKYIRKYLVPKKIETIYILGQRKVRPIMEAVCETFRDTYEVFRTQALKTGILLPDGSRATINQVLMILRLRGVPVFQPSDG